MFKNTAKNSGPLSNLSNQREAKIISYIYKLLDNYQWVHAHEIIEKFIDADLESSSEKAIFLREELQMRMKDRKRELLGDFKEAIRLGATDRAIVTLRELDDYLTVKEGAAMQGTVKKLFRKKLCDLGEKFRLAVTGKEWLRALQIGLQIIHDFPNSKMAKEIEGNLDTIKRKVAHPEN